jgi:hypothetical protein
MSDPEPDNRAVRPLAGGRYTEMIEAFTGRKVLAIPSDARLVIGQGITANRYGHG